MRGADLDDLRLDEPTVDDARAVHRICSDPRLWRHLPSGRFADPERSLSLVHDWIAGWERDGLSAWIVRDSATGRVLGYAGCWVKDDCLWNLGYRLAVDVHGRGIATRVGALAVDRARGLRPDLPVVAILPRCRQARADGKASRTRRGQPRPDGRPPGPVRPGPGRRPAPRCHRMSVGAPDAREPGPAARRRGC